MNIANHKWSLILGAVGLLAGGVLAYHGVVPDALVWFGYVFAAIRVGVYLVLFVFFFDELTSPLLTLMTGDPTYGETHVRPYRYRCLLWALLLEAFLVWLNF